MSSPFRHLYTGIFRFVLVSLLAMVLLAGTSFLFAVSVAYFQSSSWDRPAYLILGLSCGLIVWLFVAIFHLRRETHALSFPQRESFLAEACTILNEMGYELASQLGDETFFRPTFHSFLFGGGIRISIDGRIADLTGPKVSLEIFRRSYRLQQHLLHVQRSFLEHRKFTDNLLKRVELRMRLVPEQFEAVKKNVIEALAQDGTVVCELNLLVQSERGIPENKVDFRIREWLECQEIPCDIHKDRVRFVEVVRDEADLAAVSA